MTTDVYLDEFIDAEHGSGQARTDDISVEYNVVVTPVPIVIFFFWTKISGLLSANL